MILNREAKRHHYSMFNVGRSMFDVHLLNQPRPYIGEPNRKLVRFAHNWNNGMVEIVE